MRASRTLLAFAVCAAAMLSAPASAQDYYVSLSAGGAWLQDSDNSGDFSSDFTTGAGTTIPAGVVLPEGTPLGWTTEFDAGYVVSGAIGRGFGANLRGEIELSYQANDIDTHKNVSAGGIALGAEDAGVLITGSPNLGVTVADLVNDGEGGVDATYVMANLYYDFAPIGPVRPYVGGGLGAGFVDVDYSPSGVGIVKDEATVLAYQVMAGAAFDISERMALFAQYRYRASDDIETDVDLFDASLNVENRTSALEAGVRIRF